MLLKTEYLKILIFFFVSFCFVSLLVGLSIFLNKKIYKTSSFKPVECGSHSFGSGKNKVEINFYIITILFVIFEVEFIVLIPWLFYLKLSYFYSFLIMIVFLIILVLGLLFEYCRGIFKLDSNIKDSESVKSDEIFIVDEEEINNKMNGYMFQKKRKCSEDSF
jgi:NADH:ubiquinone oxidoreductase subunit 3 (subunit A)